MFCENCGSEIYEGAKFCAICGAEVTTPGLDPVKKQEVVNQAPVEQKPKKKSKAKTVTLIIRNSLITLLAILMFAFSFLPIMSIGTTYYGLDFEAQFSTIDSMSLLFASFVNYESADENPIYDEITELTKNLTEEIQAYGDISEREALRIFKNEINKIVILTMKVSLSLEDVKASISLWFAAIFSLFYMILTTAFLVLSILNLLASLKIFKVGKRFEWWSTAVFVAAPVMLLLLFYTMGISYSSGAARISLSGFSIALLAVGTSVIVYSIVQRMIFAREKNVRVFVMRGVVAVLALVIMISTLIPVFNSVISRKNVSMGAGTFNQYSTLTDEPFENTEGVYDKNEIASIKEAYEQLSTYTSKELATTAGITGNGSIVSSLIVCGFHRAVSVLFAFIPVIYIVVLMLAAAILWYAVKYLITGEENKTPYLVFKILTMGFALVLLGFVITFVAIASQGAHTVIGKGYSINIGVSSILITSLAIVIMGLPTFKNKVVDYYDEEEEDGDDVAVEEPVECASSDKETKVSHSFECVVNEIKALKELYDIGAITEEEFAAKKAKLLEI